MDESKSQTYETSQKIFQKIKESLSEFLSLDLSKLHVHNDWSSIPYLQDHLNFLLEQVCGLSDNLKDEPPAALPDEVKALRDSFTEYVP